jgi:hypothetical protein
VKTNSWEFERQNERIRLTQRATRDRPALIVETPSHQATLEFGTLLELHEFQADFEGHLLTSGWSLARCSQRVVNGD